MQPGSRSHHDHSTSSLLRITAVWSRGDTLGRGGRGGGDNDTQKECIKAHFGRKWRLHICHFLSLLCGVTARIHPWINVQHLPIINCPFRCGSSSIQYFTLWTFYSANHRSRIFQENASCRGGFMLFVKITASVISLFEKSWGGKKTLWFQRCLFMMNKSNKNWTWRRSSKISNG